MILGLTPVLRDPVLKEKNTQPRPEYTLQYAAVCMNECIHDTIYTRSYDLFTNNYFCNIKISIGPKIFVLNNAIVFR